MSDLSAEIETWIDYYDEYDQDDGDDAQYDRAAGELAQWLSTRCRRWRRTKPALVAVTDDTLDPAVLPHPLWENVTGRVKLQVVQNTVTGWSDKDRRLETVKTHRMYFELVGPISRAALPRARIESMRTLRTIVALAVELSKPASHHQAVPRIAGNELVRSLSFIRRLLDAYYSTRPEGKTLDHQIRNAIKLMVEADRQPNDAVSLSLGCAALEALASRRDNDNTITAALAENIAALLEPDNKQRLAAQKFVKDLYRQRSIVLHGDSLALGANGRNSVRALCSHVLRAILDWRDLCERMGASKRSADLFSEIESARAEGRPLVTCVESPVCKLWRTKL